MLPRPSLQEGMHYLMQFIRRFQHGSKFGTVDLIDEVQGDQSWPRSAALVGGFFSLAGNRIHHRVRFGAPYHDCSH